MQLKNALPTFVLAVVVAGVSGFATAAAQGTQPTSPPKKTTPETQERKSGGITDAWITMKIHSQFITEDALDNSDIDVDTVGGVVTLTGTVATEAGRARAVAIAKATDGVKSVNDKLRIAPAGEKPPEAAARETGREAAGAAKAGGRRVNDGWIKSKIYADFLDEDALENSDIDVDVKSGVVTLTGTVASEAGRARAVAVAKATDGVKNVKDSLKVTKR